LLAYHPRPGHVGFCVDNVKLRRNSTGILVFIAISIAPRYYTHPFIYFRRYTECPTRYRIRHFFNNFTTNEDIAMKFEADLPQCVRNVTTTNVILFKFCCNIFISVWIIKEMSGSVASGTPCIIQKIDGVVAIHAYEIKKFLIRTKYPGLLLSDTLFYPELLNPHHILQTLLL